MAMATLMSSSSSSSSNSSFQCYRQQQRPSGANMRVHCAAASGSGIRSKLASTNGNGHTMTNGSSAAELLSLDSHPLQRLSFSSQGRLVESVVYRQTFVVRSYEIGAEKTASLETYLNYFQETALNHASLTGLAGDGFGATHEMIRNNLIWVVSRMQVEVEKYPTWGDALEIDTWVAASGKNGMRRDWLVRDYENGTILARASSTWAMMNKLTRRLSRMPEEVSAEITPWFISRNVFVTDTITRSIEKQKDSKFIRSGLTPRHSDLDMNQHVNNVKYLGWTMESLPCETYESHQLVGITLQYRRECSKSDVVQSLTYPGVEQQQQQQLVQQQLLEFTHLLRLENDGSEIVRSRTTWKRR